MNEFIRVLIHIRWRLQSFVSLGFLFAMVVCRVALSLNLVAGFVSWLLLCSGITVFNSYYDKDTEPVAGLEHPPTATESLHVGGWILKLLGLFIALFLNHTFLMIYLSGIICSVLYSHKIFRFKSNAYLALIFNFIIGATTFIAAASFSHPSTQLISLGSATAGCFLASIYLLMQVHQTVEDKARGDISFAVQYGKKIALALAIAAMIIAGGLATALFLLSGLSKVYLIAFLIYFVVVVCLCYQWLRGKGRTTSDFITMNRLTLRASYAANLMLLIMYILETR